MVIVRLAGLAIHFTVIVTRRPELHGSPISQRQIPSGNRRSTDCAVEVSFFRVVATRAAPQFTSNYPHPPRISYGLQATHKYPLPAGTHKYMYLPFALIA